MFSRRDWKNRGTGRIISVIFLNKMSPLTLYIPNWLSSGGGISLIKGSLKVKLPITWRHEKQRREESTRREEEEKRERVRRKNIQVPEMLGERRNILFFRWFVGREGRKVGSLKRRVQRHLLKWAMTVARSTFWSQNAQNTPCSGSDHFWKFGCGKIARGAKHICKSKCAKHASFGPLSEVGMLENGTPLWRETHLQVKMLKNWRSQPTFDSRDVENGTPLWREVHFQVKMLRSQDEEEESLLHGDSHRQRLIGYRHQLHTAKKGTFHKFKIMHCKGKWIYWPHPKNETHSDRSSRFRGHRKRKSKQSSGTERPQGNKSKDAPMAP